MNSKPLANMLAIYHQSILPPFNHARPVYFEGNGGPMHRTAQMILPPRCLCAGHCKAGDTSGVVAFPALVRLHCETQLRKCRALDV